MNLIIKKAFNSLLAKSGIPRLLPVPI